MIRLEIAFEIYLIWYDGILRSIKYISNFS